MKRTKDLLIEMMRQDAELGLYNEMEFKKEKMNLEKAIEIVDYHQEWRLGKQDGMKYSPKELTEALYVLLDASNAKVRKDKLNQVLRRESEEVKDLKIEEAAEMYAHNYFDMHRTNHYKALKQGYEAGAKVMQNLLFNEDDLREAYFQGMYAVTSGRNFNDWFKTYKKK